MGERIGAAAEPGTVLALTGDLGSGKTSLVQGIARGLEVPRDFYVTSPTYTLINEYPGRLPLYHVDLYRIGETADFEEIGLYEILEGEGVVAIEWAGWIREELPPDHLHVDISILSEDSRKIRLTAYGLGASNLLKKVGRLR